MEADRANWDEHENIGAAALEQLRAKAKAEGLWSLQMPKERGGQGLPLVGMAACYEEMNRSIFGPVVLQLGRTRRRQHDGAEQDRNPSAEGTLAPADHRRQGPQSPSR